MDGQALDRSPVLDVSAGEIAHRLAVLRVSSADRAILHRLAPRIEARLDDFVDRFYAHIRQFPETASLLRSDAMVERLKRAQVAYFRALATHDVDRAYVDRLLRIGAAHHRVGLKPKWYIAAFSQYLTHELSVLDGYCADPVERAEAAAAWLRAVFFDISLALDAYDSRSEAEIVERGQTYARTHPETADAADGPRPSRATPKRPVRGRGIAVDADDLAERLAFIGLDRSARHLISTNRDALQPYLDRAVEAFHDLLRNGHIPRADALDEAQLERVGRAARVYWAELVQGRFDRAYSVTRVRVGMVHEQLGVPLQWYVLGMGLQLTTVVSGLLADAVVDLPVVVAVIEAAMFDMTYIIDAYLEAHIASVVEMHGFAAHVLREMTTGLLLLDAEGRVQSANWAVIRILGLGADVLRGLDVLEAVPGLAPELLGLARARQSEEELTQTVHIGARRCRVRLMSVRDRAMGWRLAVLIDDLTATLDFLSRSEVHESRLEEVVDQLSIAVWEADAESGTIEYLTDPMERFLPGATMRLLGHVRAVDGLVHPDDRAAFADAWDQAMASDARVEIEYRLPTETEVWVHGRLKVVRRGRHGRLRVRGDMYDVTESVHMRRELAERLGYQRSATALARWAMETGNEAGLIGQFLQQLAAPRAAANAWLVSRTGSTAWLTTAAADPARSLSAAALASLERIVLSTAPAPLPDLEGRYLVVPVHTEGLSEAVAVVERADGGAFSPAYLEFAQTLAGIVSGFVGRWVSDDDALRRQRMELLGTLASSVAHDLNNVLGIIRLNADALEEELGTRDAFVEDLLADVLEASERGAALTRDILTFARSTPQRDARTRLRAAFRTLQRMLRAVLPSSITLDVLPSPAIVAAVRAAHLEQLVFNLATNASAAMAEEGTIRLTARRAEVEQPRTLSLGALAPGSYAVVTVEDQGPGVPAGLARRIFEPFFTTRAAGGGTGLGLSAVARIATAAGGGIDVDQSPLGGARFAVWLPELKGVPDSMASVGAPPAGRPLRVLVADDEPPLVSLLARILDREGHEVVTCPDGAAALQFVGQRFDLVITDYNMPGANGVQVIRAFVSQGSRAAYLLVSGKDVQLTADLERAGVRRMLKPISRQALLEAVAALTADDRGR